MLDASGVKADFTPNVSKSSFTNGTTILAITMSADRIVKNVISESKLGRLELHLSFRTALEKRVHVRCFGLFADSIEVGGLGTVSTSFVPGSF